MKTAVVMTTSMFFLLIVSGYAVAGDYKLPDTGIDNCYNKQH